MPERTDVPEKYRKPIVEDDGKRTSITYTVTKTLHRRYIAWKPYINWYAWFVDAVTKFLDELEGKRGPRDGQKGE